jgi:ribose transport system permease protein
MTAVTSEAAPLRRRLFTRVRIDRGILVTLPSLILALAVLHGLKPRGIGYFDVASITSSAAPLAFAALGQTVVVVCGGLDLSAGAVLSLVNVTLVATLGSLGLPAPLVAPAAVLLAVAVGTIAGAVNGILVGLLNLPSVVVTLAVMFIAQGLALLVLPTPGGEFADAAAALIVGDAVPGLLPAAAVAIALAMAAWLLLKRMRLGIALCATGSDPESAHANGIRVPTTRVLAFTLAGAAYGLAGFAVTANTGSGDPLIGAPMLLKIFAAVVLGGVAIGGGRGSAIGAILGAVTLTTVTTLLLVSGIQTYYAPIVEGAILLGAVLLLSAGRASPAVAALRELGR